ncbi:MAG: GAF domain-containing protein [Candidatus Promineifilaceae bacterium]
MSAPRAARPASPNWRDYPAASRYAGLGVAAGLLLAALASAIVIWSAGLPLSLSSLVEAQTGEPLLWLFNLAPLALAGLGYAYGQAQDRLQAAGARLRGLSTAQAGRSAERARDLDRAVEVGHRVSRVSDLDEMLAEAVELIRDSFGLYYVQFYLVEGAGRNLGLRAGTGSAGRAMLTQNQRLPLGLGSIVGTAAVEKQTIVVANTATSQLYRPNPLLPDTWSQMAMPLLIGGRAIGVLDLQSDRPGVLSAETLPALEAVAAQLTVAVEHARLVGEASRARADLEEQARRLSRSGWEEFFDAIQRNETIGYRYEARQLTPLSRPLPAAAEDVLAVPIMVMGQTVGQIQVEAADGDALTAEEGELVAAVAEQIAQQVEGLRLLAEAERYRAEAEKATRRLTRDGWESYLRDATAAASGYVYDQGQVKPLAEGSNGQAPAALSQPLTVRGEPIGEIEVAGRPADEDASRLLVAVAEQLSAHLENLRLSQQTEQALLAAEDQARRLATLNEMSQALAAAASADDIYRTTADMLWRILPADRVSLSLINPAADSFEILSLEADKGAAKVGEAVPLVGSSVGAAVRENRVVINQSAEGGSPGIQSFMIAPLKAGGQSFGTLNVGTHLANAYSAQDARLLLQVASLVAPTLESRRLFSETERRAGELALINQMAQAVSEQLELEQLLDTVYQQVQGVLQSDAFHIGLYDADADSLDYPIMVEAGRRSQLRAVPLHPDSNTARVLSSGEPLLRNLTPAEVEAIRRDQPPTLIGDDASIVTASLIYVPLRSGQRTHGVMSVQSYRYTAYKPSDMALLTGIANYVAVALDNAQLFQQARIQAEELAILNEMGRRLTSLVDPAAILETVFQHTGRLMPAASFYVALYDASRDQVDIQLFGQGEQAEPAQLRRRAGQGVTEYIIRSRRPLLIPEDVAARFAELGIEPIGRPALAWLGVPMLSADEVIGVVGVQSFDTPRAYDEHDQDLLTAVAGQTAIALENAQLFAQVQSRARREQILREVTARVRGTADVDTVMRTAAAEIGRALGRETFVLLGGAEPEGQTADPEGS